jgi:hypothetical protein
MESVLLNGRHTVWDSQIGDFSSVEIKVVCIVKRIGILRYKVDSEPCGQIRDVDPIHVAATIKGIVVNGKNGMVESHRS